MTRIGTGSLVINGVDPQDVLGQLMVQEHFAYHLAEALDKLDVMNARFKGLLRDSIIKGLQAQIAIEEAVNENQQ